MKSRLWLFSGILFSIYQIAAAQSDQVVPVSSNEWLLEAILQRGGSADELESALHDLEILSKNPIELNRAGREDLEKLPFLTDFQISSFLEYRQEKGNLISINELQTVYGFSESVIGMILPYVYIADGPEYVRSNEQPAGRNQHEISLKFNRNIEKSAGYLQYDSLAGQMHYPGSPWYMNAQYGFESNNRWKAGLTLEKDAGEEMFTGTNKQGFDFISGHVMIKKAWSLRNVIFGDFRPAFGQGLTLWSGASAGKSSLPLNIVKRQDAVRPFVSNDENNFMRGIAGSTSFGNFTLTAFISSKRRDANITDTLENGGIYFSSFQESGYHRSSSETTDEKTVQETALGANLLWRSGKIKAGSTLVAYQFDKTLQKGTGIKDVHKFSGNSLINWGTDYMLILKRIQLFGEISEGNGHWATIQGALFNMNKFASFSMLYRNYSAGFYSQYSASFSENSTDSNEEGMYAGIRLHPAKKLTVSGYVDFYRFPWLTYHASAPSNGNDYLLHVEYDHSKAVAMYLRVKFESKEEDINDTVPVAETAEAHLTGIRYHISYKLSGTVSMQNRMEANVYRKDDRSAVKGFMFYHDIRYSPLKIPVVFEGRFTWFNTGGYSSRIYAYEQDMTSGYSFTPLYDHGFRSYLIISWQIYSNMAVGIRYSNLVFSGKKEIGSGYDRIASDQKNDLKIRLALRF